MNGQWNRDIEAANRRRNARRAASRKGTYMKANRNEVSAGFRKKKGEGGFITLIVILLALFMFAAVVADHHECQNGTTTTGVCKK